MQQKNTDIQMKDQLLQRKLDGESVASIAADTGIPRSTLYSWIAEAREAREEENHKKSEQLALDPRSYYKQKEHIEKLEGMLEVLRAVFDVSEMPLDKRLKVLEEFYHSGKYSVRLMCEVLEVPRGTFYNYINRGLKGNTQAAKRREVMKARIRDIYYDSNQIYGAAKIHAILKEQGEAVTIEYVRELMREMDLQSIINSLIDLVVGALNMIQIDIPDWVPLIGGWHFGFNLVAPQIPYLAQGAVIPPNREFMAVLGDQKYGTNIEALEDLIRKIVREETAGLGGSDRLVQLMEILIDTVESIEVGDETIGKAAARYSRSTARARGT